MTPERSNAITNTKYLLMVLIVFLHCSIHTVDLDDPSRVFCVMDDLLKILYDAATPAFFFLSSYLLFRTLDQENYSKKLISRFNSLIIPFILAQLIAFFIITTLSLLLKGSLEVVPIKEFIINIFTQKYNRPLWFLTTLFEFVVCAPAVYVFFQYFNKKKLMVLVGGGHFVVY